MTDELTQRRDVVRAALDWVGTPWHHAARVKGAGVDCAQLLIAAYAEAGLINEFDPGPYPIDHMLHSDDQILQGWCERLGRSVDHPKEGDVVLWQWGRTFSHAGIVMDWPGRVIHAFRPFGGVCVTPAGASRLADRQTVFYTFW